MPSWVRLLPSRSALQLLQPMGGVGETGAGAAVGVSAAATAGDIPAVNPRASSTGSRRLINLACIERLLSMVNGDLPCPYWSNSTCSTRYLPVTSTHSSDESREALGGWTTTGGARLTGTAT